VRQSHLASLTSTVSALSEVFQSTGAALAAGEKAREAGRGRAIGTMSHIYIFPDLSIIRTAPTQREMTNRSVLMPGNEIDTLPSLLDLIALVMRF